MTSAVAPPAGGWDCHVHVFDPAAARLPGHYEPAAAPLHEIERLGAAHGITRLVLVQPSVYGTDNTVLLQALRAGAGRHRGVAVVDDGMDEDALAPLHAAGVRGVRFNLVSPVGNGCAGLPRLAPLLQRLGWHVQWYAHAEQLPLVADYQERTGLRFVLDHLAGLDAAQGASDAAWQALRRLAANGAWLKLSGWYRLGCAAPYDAIVPLVERAGAPFGDRLVWGSDWPHTALARTPQSRHASLLEPVRHALGDAALQRVLHDHPRRLYDA